MTALTRLDFSMLTIHGAAVLPSYRFFEWAGLAPLLDRGSHERCWKHHNVAGQRVIPCHLSKLGHGTGIWNRYHGNICCLEVFILFLPTGGDPSGQPI